MQIAFRTDASTQIGTGHVMRCLTLADALAIRGAQSVFVCREHPGHLLELIRARGHQAIALPLGDMPHDAHSEIDSAHAQWLGADWASDAQQTLAALQAEHVDWLIVDHYALDARWEKQLAGHCDKLMVIDDLADRPHACDLLLDQNWLGTAPDMRYAGLLPERCRTFLGPRYALLAPEYEKLRASMPERDGSIKRILVFMGGADAGNQTVKVMQALTDPAFEDLAVDVVVGMSHPDPAPIRDAAAKRPATTLHQGLPSLAKLMANADLMIGAGGSTAWERMCLGLPAIVIGIAQNQLAISRALMAADYIRFLGEKDVVTAADITDSIAAALKDHKGNHEQSLRCRELVTGTGATDIATILIAEASYNDSSLSY
ncbi:UDP-2,4-diacetamido-2,4,6-trideoxy-beta-L-altropyranose hydrolase [Herbaspirillum seropedicae]|uniref:UDP-2,4-diacetamido-2,4, 6-trideoxy-beta-L-altropyranose hydrolase n=1 Tax=Herbaspirillum seropedicae TaxID=964 RepID=UPI003F8D3BA9